MSWKVVGLVLVTAISVSVFHRTTSAERRGPKPPEVRQSQALETISRLPLSLQNLLADLGSKVHEHTGGEYACCCCGQCIEEQALAALAQAAYENCLGCGHPVSTDLEPIELATEDFLFENDFE